MVSQMGNFLCSELYNDYNCIMTRKMKSVGLACRREENGIKADLNPRFEYLITMLVRIQLKNKIAELRSALIHALAGAW